MKVILVTGGSSGIGASTAIQCAARGMGVVLTYHNHLAVLADGGHIVNVTSATTRVATSGVAPYAAFKGGLEVLTRYMAKEFGPRRIRANAISPGAIRTGLGGGLNDEFEALLASQTALGRVGEPDDVGKAIASLVSDENGWVNAQSIEVAGGYHI
ncbi:SDR family NAD(P)-dependent oxidoreductase [Rahnella victoriana]|uniref:SDR family NAD(P)-dependent oxidoreductase n=1 Tax=Rahnella victoriana TaxID=1510570 RepID=UPI001E449B3E|nr:SDR family oxidoreductase [Rahnella victoriana]UHM93076.1 SDR family oxidoreductase [Rahnella victoriana]